MKMKYCIVDVIYGDVDSVHEDSHDAMKRFVEIYDVPDREWDIAYWDEEEGKPGRLMSYTSDMFERAMADVY